MKMKRLLKRGMAYLLTIFIVIGLMPYAPDYMENAKAAENTNIVKIVSGLGVDVIANPVVPTSASDAWRGNYVYLGVFKDAIPTSYPIKFRVLDNNSKDYGNATMLLDCDSVLWMGAPLVSKFDDDSNIWMGKTEDGYLRACDLLNFLNTYAFYKYFSNVEQCAMPASIKEEKSSTDGNGHPDFGYALTKESCVFVLDAVEATNPSYGYYNSYGNAVSRQKRGVSEKWWLRSPYSNSSDEAAIIDSDGSIISEKVYELDVAGVSPALNLRLSNILFSSIVSGSAGEIGAEYKLTLIDEDMTIDTNGTITNNDNVISIPYVIGGINGENATQVSVLVLDKLYEPGNINKAEIKYYGALDTSKGNGTAEFTLPDELSDKVCGRDYFAYIIAEDVNGEKETDNASAPLKINIPNISQKMNIGVKGIFNPKTPTSTSDEWNGSYVYFGSYNQNPVKYRVLDNNTSVFGGTTMLLDCDSILWHGVSPDGESANYDTDSSEWATSDINEYLNSTFLAGNFSMLEQNAIAASTKAEVSSTDGAGTELFGFSPLAGEKIFLLDLMETMNESYGYSNILDAAANRKKTELSISYWTRSVCIEPDCEEFATSIIYNGNISFMGVAALNMGVSPSLNVNLSSVFLSSTIGMDKFKAITKTSVPIGRTMDTEWKLTLKDSGKTIKVTDGKKVTKTSDGTITVPYTYSDKSTLEAEKVNQISVMITDKKYTEADANIMYYGALQGMAASSTTGKGTFVLPSGLDGKSMGKDYYVYIIAEHTTNANATDYASAPVEITNVYEDISNPTTEKENDDDNDDKKENVDDKKEQLVKAKKLTITAPSNKLAAGKKMKLTVTFKPANVCNKEVKWTVSNKKYATVNSKGVVTAKKAGIGKKVTITATAKDGSKKKAKFTITIMKDSVKSIKLKAVKSIKAGKSVTVKATVKTTGKKANKKLKWTTSNKKYATVNSKGKVVTKKAGKGKTVKITAKATDGSGKKATITIKIK